jgi:hypothetical protein
VILYKKLACNNLVEINQQILSYIHTLNFESQVFWNPVPVGDFIKCNPLLTEWLMQNHLPVKSIAVTRGVDANCCGPHTDTPPSRYKLSWPVHNTQHTWNRWFKAESDAPVETNHLGGVCYLDPAALTEIDRMQVDAPAIISTGVPHDVWCESGAQFPRWGLQCQLFNEPTSL